MRKATWLMGALVLGMTLGGSLHPIKDTAGYEWLTPLITEWIGMIGQIFLRLIFMIVVPLVVSALLLGTYELACERGMGRVFGKTLLGTVIASTAAVAIGVTLVSVLQPGAGTKIAIDAAASESVRDAASKAKPLSQTLLDLLPRNPLDSAVRALDGELIALMVACLIIGAAMSAPAVREKVQRNLVPLLETIFAICIQVVAFAMMLAPAGVFSLALNAAFRNGFGLLVSLLGYVGVVLLALLIQQFVVYGAMLRFLAGRSPWKFFADCREVYLYAFSTSSSNATLPKSLEVAETKLGIPAKIARFVLTVGATGNQNGTALFEGITVLFLAQVYGVHLGVGQQISVVLMSILAGVGTAGVPGGSLPLIVIVMQSVGVPAEGIGLVLGVDRFLDMSRTVINVSGDLVIAAVVAKGAESEPVRA